MQHASSTDSALTVLLFTRVIHFVSCEAAPGKQEEQVEVEETNTTAAVRHHGGLTPSTSNHHTKTTNVRTTTTPANQQQCQDQNCEGKQCQKRRNIHSYISYDISDPIRPLSVSFLNVFGMCACANESVLVSASDRVNE